MKLLDKLKKIEFTIQARVVKCDMTFANKKKSTMLKGKLKPMG
jgi:hypothetical protein